MANNNKTIIDDNSIISTIETEREQVREKSQIYFGTNDALGCSNGVFELITNGIDEIREGHGDTVETTIDSEYNITVEDNGSGVPMAWNSKDKRFNWDCVYNKMFSSGKHEHGAYAEAAGLNGVGASITQFTSAYMKVISRRIEKVYNEDYTKCTEKKVEYEMNFENGFPKGSLIERDWTGTHTGTTVKYRPDEHVFQSIEVTPDMFLEKMRKLAVITPRCHVVLNYMNADRVDFYFKDGPETFLKDVCPERITKDIIVIEGTKDVYELKTSGRVEYPISAFVAFTFSNTASFVESYHNGAFLIENGKHYTAFKAAVKSVLEEYAKRVGKLSKTDKFNPIDIDEMLVCIVSSRFKGVYSSFKGQDKKAIENDTLIPVFDSVVKDGFIDWSTTHKEEMDKIVDAVLLHKDAREKADSVRKTVLKKLTASINGYKSRPAKLTDCISRNTLENEIYIVEGDSAKGSAVQARDEKIQAVFPLIGKILNCLKAPYEVILNNAVIQTLCQIIGCGLEIESKYLKDLPKFDINKLNYGKIIISTDADLDGFHIQCLVLVFLYKMMPTLIRTGHVYIAEAPLFRVETSADSKYAYSDEEKDAIVAEFRKAGIKKIDIKRFKGLGEMDCEQMAESTMSPITRRLTQVEFPTDEEQFKKIVYELLGDDIDERKEWISDYFEMDE